MSTDQIQKLQSVIASNHSLVPRGGRSKTALTPPTESLTFDLSGLTGILEYSPSEYTFTALAGTPVADINQALDSNGQFLPFDPPLVEQGATLGGTIASGLSGSGRYRYGGVRDFILAVQYFDGEARLVRAGGKVVKNAAGFDLPKLMVGSLGAYGAMVEVTFKVFPKPLEYVTYIVSFPTLQQALQCLIRTTSSPFDLFSLDLDPQPDRCDLILRIGGMPASFPDRLKRLKEFHGEGNILEYEQDQLYWRGIREFSWVGHDQYLVKVPLTPKQVPQIDSYLADQAARRRYTVGANLVWVEWSKPLDQLDRILSDMHLSGLVVLGLPGKVRLGQLVGATFARRVKAALDPQGRWLEM
jgi:glycolate oxidase FAD binding subunit